MPSLCPRECRIGQGQMSLESSIALTVQEKNKIKMLFCSFDSAHFKLRTLDFQALELQDEKKKLSVTTVS